MVDLDCLKRRIIPLIDLKNYKHICNNYLKNDLESINIYINLYNTEKVEKPRLWLIPLKKNLDHFFKRYLHEYKKDFNYFRLQKKRKIMKLWKTIKNTIRLVKRHSRFKLPYYFYNWKKKLGVKC